MPLSDHNVSIHIAASIQGMATVTATGVVAECDMLMPPGSPITEVESSGDRRGESEPNDECAICLQQMIEAAAFPAAGCPHVYCVTCIQKLQAHTPTQSIVCPQCRRQAPRPTLSPRLPPPPVSKARKAVILTIMFITLGLCFVALAYDIGFFGVPFYSDPKAPTLPHGVPLPAQRNETLSRTSERG